MILTWAGQETKHLTAINWLRWPEAKTNGHNPVPSWPAPLASLPRPHELLSLGAFHVCPDPTHGTNRCWFYLPPSIELRARKIHVGTSMRRGRLGNNAWRVNLPERGQWMRDVKNMGRRGTVGRLKAFSSLKTFLELIYGFSWRCSNQISTATPLAKWIGILSTYLNEHERTPCL